jgi:endonuclease G
MFMLKIKKTRNSSCLIWLMVACSGILIGGCAARHAPEMNDPISQNPALQSPACEECPVFGSQKTQQMDFPTITPVFERNGYKIAYDGKNRNPSLVMEILTQDSLQGTTKRDDGQFKEDHLIPKHMRAALSDYRSSGYDRGHMAPAADFRGNPKAMEESFLLTNMCPQDPQLNRGYWSKFERHVRELTKSYKSVKVFTGPLYLPQTGKDGQRYVTYKVIGKNDVAVPTHFFKVLVLEKANGKKDSQAYILPNEDVDSSASLDKFKTTVEKVERASGIIFSKS